MWTPEHRRAADHKGLRYLSDLTDAEWTIVDPMIPPARHGGRKRSVNVREVLNRIFYALWTGCRWKACIFADGGYAGKKVGRVVSHTGTWKLEIVKRPAAPGFEVLPKRWIVERTCAWVGRNRRLARDFERYAMTVAAFIRLAMIRIIRLLATTPSSCAQTPRMGSSSVA